jgi:hypothetical protein
MHYPPLKIVFFRCKNLERVRHPPLKIYFYPPLESLFAVVFFQLDLFPIMVSFFCGRIRIYTTNCHITPFEVHGSRFILGMMVSALKLD